MLHSPFHTDIPEAMPAAHPRPHDTALVTAHWRWVRMVVPQLAAERAESADHRDPSCPAAYAYTRYWEARSATESRSNFTSAAVFSASLLTLPLGASLRVPCPTLASGQLGSITAGAELLKCEAATEPWPITVVRNEEAVDGLMLLPSP